MANIGTKLVIFLIAAHTLIFFAQTNNFLTKEETDNPHKGFLDQFLTGSFSDSVQVSADSGIISGTIRLAAKATDFIGIMFGILFSPFTLTANANMPPMLKVLIQTMLVFLEGSSIASFIRGKDY